MAKLIQGTEDLDQELSMAGDKLVVIYFSAVWCGPCMQMGPVVEAMATPSESPNYQDVIFLKVDVDESEDVAERYDIEAMPTFKFIRSGEVVETVIGANSNALKSKLDATLNA
mmetsp:Transcript_3998/g.5563  ORF Transcript_3998/g.5563 Transcript_3998/m.5563 type:complete len:113 (+) Transcript_3998:133-471(+)|eukprot:CAMPEP_0117753018 /NCGR_PEP_ID=MMETSP0947-20121206/11972_1 /TAXON_ID=44440 /ORGANISM="Chattonella subsalsa, Strain CCMP2191" /LENGTH=112 /DNA_ID=CAMNT_0005571813 /DNA_START=133 /DNA_END=471 /DNA_ORIENTATION=-